MSRSGERSRRRLQTGPVPSPRMYSLLRPRRPRLLCEVPVDVVDSRVAVALAGIVVEAVVVVALVLTRMEAGRRNPPRAPVRLRPRPLCLKLPRPKRPLVLSPQPPKRSRLPRKLPRTSRNRVAATGRASSPNRLLPLLSLSRRNPLRRPPLSLRSLRLLNLLRHRKLPNLLPFPFLLRSQSPSPLKRPPNQPSLNLLKLPLPLLLLRPTSLPPRMI